MDFLKEHNEVQVFYSKLYLKQQEEQVVTMNRVRYARLPCRPDVLDQIQQVQGRDVSILYGCLHLARVIEPD